MSPALYKDVHGTTVDLRAGVPDNVPHLDEVCHVVECVRGVTQPIVTPEDRTRLMTIVDAIDQSALSQRGVPIAEARRVPDGTSPLLPRPTGGRGSC
jgi:predicted dehydrogenase